MLLRLRTSGSRSSQLHSSLWGPLFSVHCHRTESQWSTSLRNKLRTTLAVERHRSSRVKPWVNNRNHHESSSSLVISRQQWDRIDRWACGSHLDLRATPAMERPWKDCIGKARLLPTIKVMASDLCTLSFSTSSITRWAFRWKTCLASSGCSSSKSRSSKSLF